MNTGRQPEPIKRAAHNVPVQTFASICSLKPERDFLVKGLFLPGTCSMLFGRAGCTKSLFANRLLLSIALGKPFLGLPTKRHGVLLLDNEDSPQLLRDRFHSLLAGMDTKRKPQNFWVVSRIGPIDAGDTIDQILTFCQEYKISLIALDTLRRCTAAEENSSSEISTFFQLAITPFLQAGISVLFLHHAQKQKNGQYRGSGDILGFTDSAFSLELQGTRISLRCEKSRTSEPDRIFADWTFASEKISLERIDTPPEQAGDSGLCEKILSFFVTPGATLQRCQISDGFDDLREKGGLPSGWPSKSVVDKALRKLVRQKFVLLPKKGFYVRNPEEMGLSQGKMVDYAGKKAE